MGSIVFEDLVGPRYSIVQKIGYGSYGSVYKAYNNEQKRYVAIKRMENKSMYGLPCIIEPYIMSSIIHPCILNSEEILHFTDSTAIVMPLARTNVYEYLKSHPNVTTLQQKIQWIYSVIQAVAVLHQQNIIHGDIKSTNCIITTDKQCKLCDFSLSLVSNPSIRHKHVVCTYTHRAPEIIQGREWSFPVDIWALGCTIYEILYSKVLFPYQGGSCKEESEVIDNRVLSCYRTWCTNTQQSDTFALRRSLKHIPPSAFKSDPEYSQINDIIVQCCQVDINKRIDITSLLQHPMFQPAIYHVAFRLSPVPARATSHKKYDIQPCHQSIVYLVQAFIDALDVSIDSDLLYWSVCTLVCKLTHNKLKQNPPFPWNKIVATEMLLSRSLQYRLPLALLNYGKTDKQPASEPLPQ